MGGPAARSADPGGALVSQITKARKQKHSTIYNATFTYTKKDMHSHSTYQKRVYTGTYTLRLWRVMAYELSATQSARERAESANAHHNASADINQHATITVPILIRCDSPHRAHPSRLAPS